MPRWERTKGPSSGRPEAAKRGEWAAKELGWLWLVEKPALPS